MKVNFKLLQNKKKEKKNLKKIIISLVIIISIISSISSCLAFDIGEKELNNRGECPRLLTYKGVPIKVTYITYNHNGFENPAYCLDVNLDGAEKGTYTVMGSTKLQDVEVWRAIINGFPYKSLTDLGAANEMEAFTATKQAVYTMILGRSIDEYGPVNSDEGRRTYEIYKNIVNAARSSSENIENNFNINIIPVTESWAEDNVIKGYVSKRFKVTSNVSKGNIDVFLQGTIPEGTEIADISSNLKHRFSIGEEFKILIPINHLLQDETLDICAKVEMETKPVAYGSSNVPGKQSYALTGCWFEEIYTKISEKYNKNITKLRLIKKEYGTENVLSNVKFNLLDENKNVFLENLTTDGNGEIILENMLPGKYFIQEVETLEGYNMYTDLIEVNLELNQEFTVTVNNTKKEVEIYDKNFAEIEVVPNDKETHYKESNSTTLIESNKDTKKVEFNDNTNLNQTNISTRVEKTNVGAVKKLPKTGY